MRTLTVAAIWATSAVVAGCTGGGRIDTYAHSSQDADVVVAGRRVFVWFHRRDNTLIMQRGFGVSLGQDVGSALTFHAVNLGRPASYWRAAAKAVLDQIGCTVDDVRMLDNEITWEASFSCPIGTDVDAAVKAHRPRWRAGIIAPSDARPARR